MPIVFTSGFRLNWSRDFVIGGLPFTIGYFWVLLAVQLRLADNATFKAIYRSYTLIMEQDHWALWKWNEQVVSERRNVTKAASTAPAEVEPFQVVDLNNLVEEWNLRQAAGFILYLCAPLFAFIMAGGLYYHRANYLLLVIHDLRNQVAIIIELSESTSWRGRGEQLMTWHAWLIMR